MPNQTFSEELYDDTALKDAVDRMANLIKTHATKTYVDSAVEEKQDKLIFDSTPAASSTNPVTSGGVKTALDAKQDTLIFDTKPTAESTKPVTSAGIHAAIGELKENINDSIYGVSVPASTETGKYINASGGLSNDASYDACDFVDVSGYTEVSFSTSLNSARGFAFYKADKTTTTLVVNGNNCATYGYTSTSTPQTVKFDVPTDSVYLRFTRRNTFDVTANAFAVSGKSYGGLVERIFKTENDIANMADAATIATNALTLAETNTDARKLSYTWVDGYYINLDGGESASASYSCTDYVYVGGLEHITFPLYVPDGSAGMVVVYDENKAKTQYIQNITDPSGTIREINLTDKDKYVRFTCYGTRKSQFYVIADKIAESIAKTCRLALGERDVPDSKIIRDGGMTRIFNKIGVIGDSLSSGEMAYGDAVDESTVHYVDMYQYSWIQYLAKACGTTAYNFSQGGMNTRNFLADLGGFLTKLRNSDYKCQAYFIALCHNDDNYGVPVGSPSDVDATDPTQSADTFYGNYAHIIAEIKAIEPNAKIFCICSKVSSLAPYNVAIRYMATIFTNIYILDFENYFPKLETNWEYTQGHGNAMGYLNYSWQIGTYVDYIIRNNRTAFKYVQFIGTEYEQYIPSN